MLSKMKILLRYKPAYRRLLFSLLFLFLFTFLFCEFFVYYLQFLLFCKWPSEPTKSSLESIESKKVLILSDTHLLGKFRGHWFDKLRREWQMYRSFQTAVELFHPEFVFILGDVFDEGQYARPKDFQDDVRRFHEYFHVPNDVKLYVVAGNHDIGFHYRTHPILYNRFDSVMNTTSVDSFNLTADIRVIRINSIAMENDGCDLCEDARRRISSLSQSLAKNPPSRVILLTHFPLYRRSESVCSDDIDNMPEDQRSIPHKEGIDCLSRAASDFILQKLKPNLIYNGHVHYSCRRERWIEGFNKTLILSEEITVSSFNWRNRNSPSFLLLRVGKGRHEHERCFVPNENFVFGVYGTSLLISILLIIFTKLKFKSD